MNVYLVESTTGEYEDMRTFVEAVFERREDAVRYIESQQVLLAMTTNEDGETYYYDAWYADDMDDDDGEWLSDDEREFYRDFTAVQVSPTPHSSYDGSTEWYVDNDCSYLSTSYRVIEMVVL